MPQPSVLHFANMSTELSNLLPAKQQRALRHHYFFRLATVTLLALAALVVAHGLLLLPTYLYSEDRSNYARAQLATLEGSLESAEEELVKARSAQFTKAVERLTQLDAHPVASAVIRAVLAVPRPGITLTGFTVTAPTAQNSYARMQVSGTAASRDDLRAYTSSLGTLPFVTTADLPISAYAKENAIPFTITLTGTLLP